jgi:hypothetical protein
MNAGQTRLDMPFLAEDHRLHTVLSSALRARGLARQRTDNGGHIYWPAEQFSLPQSRLYREAKKEDQRAILERCCEQVLEEAYYIEKAGMAYTAKMALLSQSTEERMLYSLFSADEASHFELIRGFIDDPTLSGSQPFLSFLEELIDHGHRDTLIFTIQVVLEGWGLSHYRGLSESCIDDSLKPILAGIVQDEARHHGSGLVLTDNIQWSDEVFRETTQTLQTFLSMIQCGPQGVVSAFDTVLGGLTRTQRIELFSELNAPEHSTGRLDLLRTLMRGHPALIEQLESTKSFRSLSAQECAQ